MSFELILPFLRPIEPLLLDESVSEIMGNPDASWFYERDGRLCQEPSISFDAGKLRTGLEVIANQLGKRLDEDNPRLHAQLPDGSRLAAWIPPLVSPAPAIAIRKFTSRHYTVDDLIARGTLTQAACRLLGRADSQRKDAAYQRRNRHRKDDAFADTWPTSFRTMNASSLSKIPRNFKSRSRTSWPPNARPIRSRPTSLSTIF